MLNSIDKYVQEMLAIQNRYIWSGKSIQLCFMERLWSINIQLELCIRTAQTLPLWEEPASSSVFIQPGSYSQWIHWSIDPLDSG